MPDAGSYALEKVNNAKNVRYIKLGEGNKNAKHCFEKGFLVLGFWTYKREMYEACIKGDWAAVELIIRRERTLERNGVEPKSIKNDLRQVKEFFDDDGTTLWITFDNRKMYWGFGRGANKDFIDETKLQGCYRHMSVGWSCQDISGNFLSMDDISGSISMVSQYRGTICKIKDVEYIKRRICGLTSEVFLRTTEALNCLHLNIIDAIRLLTPTDFELLVEMIFVNSGWRRVGFAGGTEQLVDMILSRPSLIDSSKDTVAVQVKSTANQNEYEKYETAIAGGYKNAFYVFHTGNIRKVESGVMKLLDAKELAELVVDAGILNWLLERVK